MKVSTGGGGDAADPCRISQECFPDEGRSFFAAPPAEERKRTEGLARINAAISLKGDVRARASSGPELWSDEVNRA